MSQEHPPSYGQEEAAYGARETCLSAVFGFSLQRVFNAVELAAERQGLKILMSSAGNGLLVARPAFSLLNLGRRVNVTFSPARSPAGPTAGSEATLVRARYTHGLVSFEDRYVRLSLLSDLFRSALLQLEAGSMAQKAAQPAAAPPADAPRAAPPAKEAAPQAEKEGSPPPYPTLHELRAKAQAQQQARRGLPAETAEEQEFMAEGPEGFRLPPRFKARRVFWFALGVVLAVVLMVLLSLSTR